MPRLRPQPPRQRGAGTLCLCTLDEVGILADCGVPSCFKVASTEYGPELGAWRSPAEQCSCKLPLMSPLLGHEQWFKSRFPKLPALPEKPRGMPEPGAASSDAPHLAAHLQICLERNSRSDAAVPACPSHDRMGIELNMLPKGTSGRAPTARLVLSFNLQPLQIFVLCAEAVPGHLQDRQEGLL